MGTIKYLAWALCLSGALLVSSLPSQADIIVQSNSSSDAAERAMEAFFDVLVRRSTVDQDQDFFYHFGLPTDRGRTFSDLLDEGLISLNRSDFSAPPFFRAPTRPLRWAPNNHDSLEDTGTPQNPDNGFNDALRFDGPLYFLSQHQRNFLAELNLPRAVRAPSLQINAEGAIWTGKCRVHDDPIPEIKSRSSVFEMISGDMPKFVKAFVNMAVSESPNSLTSSDFSAVFSGKVRHGKSEANTGLILWPSRMIGNAAMSGIVANGSEGMRRQEAFLNGEQTLEDRLFSSPEDFAGDTLVFGRIKGPYPILNSTFSFYHGPKSKLGDPKHGENGVVTYRSKFFPNIIKSSEGFWAVLLPCRSLIDVLELPLVIEMRPPNGFTKFPYFFPIPIAHPDLGIFRDNHEITPSTDHFPSAIFSSLAIDGNIGGGWHKSSLEVYLLNQVVSQAKLSQRNDYSPLSTDFGISVDLDKIEEDFSKTLEKQFIVEE